MPIHRRPHSGCFLATVLPAILASAAPQAQPSLFRPAPDSPIPVVGKPGNLVLGDVNLDAKPDLVVASGHGITVLLGQGDGRFRATAAGAISMPAPSSEMILRDLNGD